MDFNLPKLWIEVTKIKHSFRKLTTSKYGVINKEVCNGGVACSLLKLDGGWQATPSFTKFLSRNGIR